MYTRTLSLTLLIMLVFTGITFAQDSSRPSVPGGMYDKPYIKKFGQGTAIGGYVDMEWEITDNKNTFDQHRLIPFIFSEITPRIHFATELEFEHGGEEIKVEYAALDIQFTDWLVYRSGILLSPLGKFNIVHDSPWNDFVTRPLVDRYLIPTTLSEAGMGFHGTLYPNEMSVLGYELYLVNGFNSGILDRNNVRQDGSIPVNIRDGRGSPETDNNTAKSLVGRIVYSPALGVEIGASLHTGKYDANSNKRLTIGAIDATWQRGRFELLGEAAVSSTEITGSTHTNQVGFYVQPNYHFGFGVVPGFPESKFTGMFRLGYLDYNSSVTGDQTLRYSAGLNWRPVEDAAMKFEYQVEQHTVYQSTDANVSVGTFFFGMTSYF